MMFIVGKCLLEAFFGLAAALFAGLMAWNLLKLIRMPELGPWLVLLLLLVIPGAAEHTFGQMMMLFLLIVALAVLCEGPTWRKHGGPSRLMQSLRRNPGARDAAPASRPVSG